MRQQRNDNSKPNNGFRKPLDIGSKIPRKESPQPNLHKTNGSVKRVPDAYKPVLTNDHPRRQCVDLRKTFGDFYKYDFDESYRHEAPKFRAEEKAWLTVIPCKHGHIFSYGEQFLAAYTNRRGEIARKLIGLTVTKCIQDGTDGVTVVFEVNQLKAVAELMQPNRRRGRRRMPNEERVQCIERLKPYRYTPKSAQKKQPPRPSECDEEAPEV